MPPSVHTLPPLPLLWHLKLENKRSLEGGMAQAFTRRWFAFQMNRSTVQLCLSSSRVIQPENSARVFITSTRPHFLDKPMCTVLVKSLLKDHDSKIIHIYSTTDNHLLCQCKQWMIFVGLSLASNQLQVCSVLLRRNAAQHKAVCWLSSWSRRALNCTWQEGNCTPNY